MAKLSAVVVVLDPECHVLYLKRGPTDPWRPGYWNLPGGGVKADEFPLECAARELAEEAGIYAQHDALLPLPPVEVRNGLFSRPVYGFVLEVERRPRVSFLDDEHDDFMWYPMEAKVKPRIPGVTAVLAAARVALRLG